MTKRSTTSVNNTLRVRKNDEWYNAEVVKREDVTPMTHLVRPRPTISASTGSKPARRGPPQPTRIRYEIARAPAMMVNRILREAFQESTEVRIDDGLLSGDVRVVHCVDQGSTLVVKVQFK